VATESFSQTPKNFRNSADGGYKGFDYTIGEEKSERGPFPRASEEAMNSANIERKRGMRSKLEFNTLIS